MSRVGKAPVKVPAGTKIEIKGNVVSASGKFGTLSTTFSPEIRIELQDDLLKVSLMEGGKGTSAVWGLTRGLLQNMVKGVSEQFERKLEIVGVGYRAAVVGKYLALALGYSHEIKFEIPERVTIKAPKPTALVISGCDKQRVGQVAAMIIKQRPPEPYKGKGIKYEGQRILRKEGKKK